MQKKKKNLTNNAFFPSFFCFHRLNSNETKSAHIHTYNAKERQKKRKKERDRYLGVGGSVQLAYKCQLHCSYASHHTQAFYVYITWVQYLGRAPLESLFTTRALRHVCTCVSASYLYTHFNLLCLYTCLRMCKRVVVQYISKIG